MSRFPIPRLLNVHDYLDQVKISCVACGIPNAITVGDIAKAVTA